EPKQRVVLQDLVTGQTHSCETDTGLGSGVRTWLGLQRCGWGFRATFWHFEADYVKTEPSVPIKSPTCVSSFELNLDVLDIELTQKMCFHCWNVYTSVGGRYINLERASTLVGFGTLGNNVDLVGLAMGANKIDGTGFTFAIGAEKPMDCFCGWDVIWSFREFCFCARGGAPALTPAHSPPVQPASRPSAR